MTSKIKVDNIENQCGGAVVTKCGGTTTISGSVVKSNAIQASDGGNLVSQSGTTITLGASGDTINLASGASQSGFGRTGTVDWDTTPKTTSFTAVSGVGYFINTTSGAVTMTMPSGSAGAIVSIQDYNKTFDTNNLTVTPASGEKINGGAADGILIISTEGQGLTFVYVDSTVGWKTVHENEFTAGGAVELLATGGTITTCGDCKIHTFTGPGTFCVSQISTTPANNQVSYMVIAGGGQGGGPHGGGGGAGGFREDKSPTTPYTASPLDGAPSITVTATSFPITVGAGGAGGLQTTNSGSPSTFSTTTSAGGGYGGYYSTPGGGSTGGSGGGGGGGPDASGKSGNTPPVSPSQGNSGGNGNNPQIIGGGGGGAGGCGVSSSGAGGAGGAGIATSINGTPTLRAGGGGGGGYNGAARPGGAGGPGGGGTGPNVYGGAGTPGTANTGGGGGAGNCGNSPGGPGGAGGSGIVVIRYKFQ